MLNLQGAQANYVRPRCKYAFVLMLRGDEEPRVSLMPKRSRPCLAMLLKLIGIEAQSENLPDSSSDQSNSVNFTYPRFPATPSFSQ